MGKFIQNFSIRLRLTLVFSAVVCVTLVILSVSVYRSVVNTLNYEVEHDLKNRAVEISQYVASRNSFTEQDLLELSALLGGIEPDNKSPSIDRQLSNNFLASRRDLDASLTYVQISDPKGNLLQAVPDIRLMTQPVTQQILRDNINFPGEYFTFRMPDTDEPVKGYTERITLRGSTVGYVQTINSMKQSLAVSNSLIYPFGIGGIAAVVALVIFGWWITRRAFSPIENITRAAFRIGATNDLTERIQVDQFSNDEVSRLGRAFDGMLDRLEKEFKLQRHFIADSSHELRTPLTVIRGNLDLLRRNPDPVNQSESLQAIEREVKRMQKLVEDLLLLAKADANQTIEFSSTNLDEIVLEVYKQAQVLAQARHQTLKLGNFEIIKVVGDADQLKRAILNLVDNAIKYTPEEGIVTISLHSGNRWAQVAVTDTGVGIDTTDQSQIFSRFYRVEKARSRAGGGTGLGLPIVKYIVESHGGRISLDSEEGKGSTFTLWLPQISEQSPDADELEAEGQSEDSSPSETTSAHKK
ncbi:MAG: HAMP domain-containing protein [Chloroflexi bacterium]|uniref:histidine kinase n=1 Tax=Candidatus Chlorohelix allophototropha TaxID=3003348 RepID=A0A8T7LWN2_9CHLR|nr:HAMP domain-containing protein [Chloroflexota bacterium]WJW67245.1 HAMP domain-containing histidine kinase [Chloroflexota bacterium L227-S17]